MVVYDSPANGHDTLLFYLEKGNRASGYINGNDFKKHGEDIDRFKVFIPEAGGSGSDPNILSRPELALKTLYALKLISTRLLAAKEKLKISLHT